MSYIVAGIVLSFFALAATDLSFRMVRLYSGLLSLELWEGLSGKDGTVTTRKLPMAIVQSSLTKAEHIPKLVFSRESFPSSNLSACSRSFLSNIE